MFAKKYQVMLCDQSDQIISWDGIYKRRKKKQNIWQNAELKRYVEDDSLRSNLTN